MSGPTVLEEVRELARVKLDYTGPLEPPMRLVEDLGLDSIRLLTLARAVEDHFQICLDEDDESELATVGDLVAIIGIKRERQGDG